MQYPTLFRFLIVSFSLCSSAIAKDSSPAVAKLSVEYSHAFAAANWTTVADCTHKRVLNSMGGRDGYIKLMTDSMNELRGLGIRVTEMRLGAPEKEVHVGSWIASLIPDTVVMKGGGQTMTQEGCLVAISDDLGKTWTMVDPAGLGNATFFGLYPELKGAVEIPERKAPVYSKDPEPAPKPTATESVAK